MCDCAPSGTESTAEPIERAKRKTGRAKESGENSARPASTGPPGPAFYTIAGEHKFSYTGSGKSW